MSTQEMMRARHRPGYWWINVAALGEAPDWREQVAPLQADDRLFGYERDEFMAKQYRGAA